MEQSILYRRAAGYFSSSGLALAARGVASLAARGGKMWLVVSPHLATDDVDALQRATENPEEILRSILARDLVEIEDAIIQNRLNALAWLAAAGHLQIRLALRLDTEGKITRGIFHEKTGIFTDENEEHIAFTGSANETAGGLLENFESLEVFRSWNDTDARVQDKIHDFEALWENRTPGLRTLEFSEAGRDLLERFRDPLNPPDGLSRDRACEVPDESSFKPPVTFSPREYQEDAIRAWGKAGGKGILAMATGSGKTLTALFLASKVAAKNSPMVLIIICPYINLCKQWLREMEPFGLWPVPCYEGRQNWETRLEEGYQRLSAGLSKVHAIVTISKARESGRECLSRRATSKASKWQQRTTPRQSSRRANEN